MKLKLSEIPELPTEAHSFFLVPEEKATLASGSRLTFRRVGENGPELVLLHGLWTSGYTFRNLLKPLAQEFRVYIPELFCAQGPQLSAGDYSVPRLAELIVEFLDALKLQKPLVLGHAESGLAGLHLALTKPERMSSLLVAGASLRLPTSARLRGWWLGRGEAKSWARAGFSQPQQAALAMLDYADPTVVSRQEIRLLAKSWSTGPRAQATAQMLAQTIQSEYRKDLLARLEAASGQAMPLPLKMLYGDSDSRAPVEHGQQLSRLFPGAELLVAERSSGAVQVERPQWTARIITAAAAD